MALAMSFILLCRNLSWTRQLPAERISPIELADVESFRRCLDSVACGWRFLALTETLTLHKSN